jgi:HSP20 family protein
MIPAMPLVLDSRDLQAAGWAPPMDVIERPDAVEIRFDLPGVPIEAIRVSVRANALVVSGDKPPASCCPGAAFHVAERACGRFSRTIPLRLAFDASTIRAALTRGELRIEVPRIDERRGREILIPVVAQTP